MTEHVIEADLVGAKRYLRVAYAQEVGQQVGFDAKVEVVEK